MKKAKVVAVNPQGDYQLKDGRTLYKFVLTLRMEIQENTLQ